jgi:hypothetical protein
MGIGAGLFLIAAGAILAFAVNVTSNGFNLNTIGIILMVVGVVGVLIDLIIFAPRRRTAVVPVGQVGVERTVVEQRDTYR